MESQKHNMARIYRQLYKTILLLTVGYMAVLPLGQRILLYFFRIPALLCILLIGICFIREGKMLRRDFVAFLTVFAVILYGFVKYSISISIDNILSVMSIGAFLVLIITQNKVIVDKSLNNYIFSCSMAIAVILIFYSQTHFAYWDGQRNVIYLTLGMDNSNTTAIYIFLVYGMLVITMRERRKIWIPIIIEVLLVWLIWQTNSRMVLAATIAVPILSVVFRKKRIPQCIVKVCCIIPFVFVPIYLYLYDHIENIEIMGKTLFSGRQNSFLDYMGGLDTKSAWLFGNLDLYMFQNAHNGPLAIVSSIGIIGAIGFFAIVIGRLLQLNKKAFNMMAKTAIIVLIACFIHSCGEAALLLGGFPGITFMYTFYILAGGQLDTFR